MKVCVLGLGRVGLPTALYFKRIGLETYGYDINEKVITESKEKNINATSNWEDVPSSDVYVISVSTGYKENSPDLSPIFDVSNIIRKKVKSSNSCPLISIESTVPPMTCRKVYNEIFEEKLDLVHIPHRYWAGNPEKYGVKQKRAIGGINKESLERGLNFYRDILEMPLFVAPSIEVAEMCKIAENSYRYIQIAFAEELRMVCKNLNIDFESVRQACNTKWNIEILEARDGIRGHCLPKDIRYYAELSETTHLPESAMDVDESYRRWLRKNSI